MNNTLTSAAFGAFDPLQPATIAGPFAENLIADAIEIDAPIELVWQIMTGFEHYPQWNPMNRFFKLDGEAKPGHTVTFGPVWGPYDLDKPLPEAGFVQRETLTVWEPNRCLAYAALSRWMNAERVQYLCTLPNGTTRYQTFERMSGLFKPLMRRVYGARILEGFTANGRALKRRAEEMAAESLRGS